MRPLADASGGYPYAIQVMGHHACRASNASDTIEHTHASDSIVAADEDLAAGLYESRWQADSPKEREITFGGTAAFGAYSAGHYGNKKSPFKWRRAALAMAAGAATAGIKTRTKFISGRRTHTNIRGGKTLHVEKAKPFPRRWSRSVHRGPKKPFNARHWWMGD